MRIFNKFRGTKGFISTWERVLRFRYMITEQAKQRCRILAFWERHGTLATEEAFNIKRRTLFLWQQKLELGQGKLESLNPGSKKPKQVRRRLWDEKITEELKRLRWAHPNLGKDKIYPLLVIFCEARRLKCPKTKTIGRLIKDLGGLRIAPRKLSHFGREILRKHINVVRKPKHFTALYPGHCVAFDTIEKHYNGERKYVITFEDVFTRFSFAWSTNSHASKAAEEFFLMCQKLFPFSFTFVLTDNGSEFKKHFNAKIEELHLIHYHTTPRTPKMNAHLERFNRTVQEEFVNYHLQDLFTSNSFNEKLVEWLDWYNCDRVHFAFKNRLSPVQFMLSLNYSNLPVECNMIWPHTESCIFL
jgi:transposase InsO family protein